MNISFETLLSSLFGPEVVFQTPTIKEDQETITPEKVLCLPANIMEHILARQIANVCGSSINFINAYVKERQLAEFQNSMNDSKQVIVAACIHTKDQVLFLKLNGEVKGIDGYHAGTITYPQGHCTIDQTDIGQCRRFICKDGYGIENIPYVNFCYALVKNIRRELTEELHIDNKSVMDELLALTDDALIFPIYINKAGSTRGHVCMLFDIEIPQDTPLHQYFMEGKIQSGEPNKHEVCIMKYEDLIPLGSLDYICTWVASSFELLSFMKTTFIQEYQDNTKKESAPNE